MVSQTPQQVTGKKTSKIVHQCPAAFLYSRMLLVSGMCALCSASVNHAACNQTTKNKEVHSCRARPCAMHRTSIEKSHVFWFWDTKPQGDRNSSSHCRACPSFSEDVCPPRSLAMQLHRLQLRRPPRVCIGYWLWRGNCVSTTCCTRDGDLRRLVASDLQDASRLSRLWKQFFSKEPQRGHSLSKPPPLAVLQSWFP